MIEQIPFRWRHFEAEIILLCVRWYLRYSLSYREPSGDDARTGSARRSHHDLSPTRDAQAATRFFCKALHATTDSPPQMLPRK
jgi:transposase-like protein